MDNFRYVSKELFDIEDKALIIKFLYLCSFANIQGEIIIDNRLVNTHQLKEILQLNSTAYAETKSKLLKYELIQFCGMKRAVITKKYYSYAKKRNFYQIDCDATKYIYSQIDVRQHKYVGWFFSLYQYANPEGVLMIDPTEEIISKQQYLSRRDLCGIMHYGYNHYSSSVVSTVLSKLKINDDYVLKKVDNKYIINTSWINPYGKKRIGNSWERADVYLSGWRQAVFNRDGNKCVICGTTFSLEAHHIVNYSKDKTLRTVLSNGITLCNRHHSAMVLNGFHQIYGVRNNTKEQLQEYITNQRKQLGLTDINIDDILCSSVK